MKTIELSSQAPEWEMVKLKEITDAGQTVYPAKITTVTGVELLGLINPELGIISIPYGRWLNQAGESRWFDLIMDQVTALGVDKIINPTQHPRKIKETLGIQTTAKFITMFTGMELQSIELIRRDGEKSAGGESAAALARDFSESYPGVKVEPMVLK